MLFTFRSADTHGDLIWNDVLFRYRLGGLSCLFLSAQATYSEQEENRTFSGEYAAVAAAADAPTGSAQIMHSRLLELCADAGAPSVRFRRFAFRTRRETRSAARGRSQMQ